nr:hypothetical protein [Tanacetum cinerariifolium]
MVIEGEVLNDFSRFVGILIAEFAIDGARDLHGHKRFGFGAKDQYLDEEIFECKELSKEMGSEILPSGDGSRRKTFKPIAILIAKEKLK